MCVIYWGWVTWNNQGWITMYFPNLGFRALCSTSSNVNWEQLNWPAASTTCWRRTASLSARTEFVRSVRNRTPWCQRLASFWSPIWARWFEPVPAGWGRSSNRQLVSLWKIHMIQNQLWLSTWRHLSLCIGCQGRDPVAYQIAASAPCQCSPFAAIVQRTKSWLNSTVTGDEKWALHARVQCK